MAERKKNISRSCEIGKVTSVGDTAHLAISFALCLDSAGVHPDKLRIFFLYFRCPCQYAFVRGFMIVDKDGFTLINPKANRLCYQSSLFCFGCKHNLFFSRAESIDYVWLTVIFCWNTVHNIHVNQCCYIKSCIHTEKFWLIYGE